MTKTEKPWKRMTPARREELAAHKEMLRGKLNEIAEKRDRFAFGHGFLWAIIVYKGYRTRMLIGSIDGRADHWGIVEEFEELETVSSAWINLD